MHDDQLHMLLVRGDHTLNEIKAQKVIGAFRFASEKEIESSRVQSGLRRPGRGQGVKIVADRRVALMSDFVCGANEEGFHLTGVNWGRDLPEPQVADIRNVVDGDPSPDGKGKLEIVRGIEVGHIFQLRTKYSEAMKATFLDESGEPQPFEMGCYGIGVTRIVAAAIEQNHDERGIVFPRRSRPSRSRLVPIGYHKAPAVRAAADQLLRESLRRAGVDVLLDDRDERPGVLFADMDLIGVPHRVVLSERGLAAGNAEYKGRARREAVATRRSPTSASLLLKKARLRRLLSRPAARPAPLAALGGEQKYEPLADSVRARLSTQVAAARAGAVALPLRRTTPQRWLETMDKRLEKRIPDRKQRLELLRTVQYEATRARLDPQLVLGRDRGRKRLSRSTRSRLPARAATCRSCLSG